MLTISSVRTASPTDWESIWRECSYATFFQSPQWSDLWCSLSRGKLHPAPRLLSFSDGREALLPLTVRHNNAGLRKSYQSSPAGTYGGWLSRDNLDAGHLRLLREYLTTRFSRIYWRVNPIAPGEATSDASGFSPDETHCLDLSAGFASVLKGWSKGHYSAARKAQREGVEVTVAASEEDWDRYYAAYLDSVRRWGEDGGTAYPRELFRLIARFAPELMRLWLARYRGEVIAGSLCFYAPRHVVYWHGAALEEFFPLRPVHALIYEAIRDATERGYGWFDFNPSGGNSGVAHFKSGFGAQTLPSPVFVSNRSLLNLFSRR